MSGFHRLFGEPFGNALFSFMVICAFAISMAQAGIAMSVIGVVIMGTMLMFVWVGMLPMFIGVILVLLGSASFVKVFKGG